MSDPHVYPEAPGAPLQLPAAAGTPAPTFTPIEQLASADPTTPKIPKTMFIRVAMSGADCPGVTSATAPNFYVRADTGEAVLINDHTQPPNQTYSIFRRSGSNPADFIGEGSVFLESHNVFRVVIAFNDGSGDYAWQLGIWNNDATAARQFTWVVSGLLANTSRPWADVAPSSLSWDVLVGGSASDSATISNKGTGAFTVNGVTPPLPAEFTLGGISSALDPNTSKPLIVTFTAPAAAPPDGVIAATVTVDITPADNAAGAAAGHNHHISLSAHVSPPNTWATKAPMPTGRTRLGLVAAGNGKLYAVGGAIPGDPALSTVEQYDPETNTWTAKAPMPTARTALGLAAAANGKLYAVGGNNFEIIEGEFEPHTFATVEEYDPATDTWTTKTPMPTARADFGLVAASNGKLYAIGGSDADLRDLATVEEYDPATDTWTTKAPMPGRRSMLGLTAAGNGRLYVMGGKLFGAVSPTTVEEYDPRTNTWASRTPVPTLRGRLALAAASSGRLYAIGGINTFVTLATVEEYDPATDSWAAKAPMPTARAWMGLAAAGNRKLYAVGGDAHRASALVEEYTPDRP